MPYFIYRRANIIYQASIQHSTFNIQHSTFNIATRWSLRWFFNHDFKYLVFMGYWLVLLLQRLALLLHGRKILALLLHDWAVPPSGGIKGRKSTFEAKEPIHENRRIRNLLAAEWIHEDRRMRNLLAEEWIHENRQKIFLLAIKKIYQNLFRLWLFWNKVQRQCFASH